MAPENPVVHGREESGAWPFRGPEARTPCVPMRGGVVADTFSCAMACRNSAPFRLLFGCFIDDAAKNRCAYEARIDLVSYYEGRRAVYSVLACFHCHFT